MKEMNKKVYKNLSSWISLTKI